MEFRDVRHPPSWIAGFDPIDLSDFVKNNPVAAINS